MGLGFGTDIASAATLDLTARNGNIVRITGTVATTAVTLNNGDQVWCYAVGAWPLTYNVTTMPTPGGVSYTCSAGDVVMFTKDGSGVITVEITRKNGLPVVTGSPIQPVSATVGSNALTVTINPTTLDFRSATLTSGTPITRTISAAISMTVSSGSTLGTVNAVQSDIAILAIDNAGTVEVAVVNIAGGNELSETGVISTTAEGGAGAADSATVIYSTTARTNVAYRVVGLVRSTQATAGTWASTPTIVQGAGGQAVFRGTSMVRLYTANGYGSTNTRIRRFTTVATNIGSSITYTDSATLGASFTINNSGVYSINYSDQFNTADALAITLNDTAPTGAPVVGETLSVDQSTGTNAPCSAAWTGYLTAGNVIYARSSGGSPAGVNTYANVFTIVRVA
jgi:hypothetical protein